ncbi:hypothetical protein VaNZ11_016236 [Volvox africanus]|uniref:Peptidase C1A papain C-terminal domain-containing protein n=1 Tax=Volvox africanus TaxID=51714 RepID=A0ABQ5SP23_9CHLO|nr:hypothetical protein VaNZ11_016236 [Volvox africanus]
MKLLLFGVLPLLLAGQANAARALDGDQSGQIRVQGPPKWPDSYEVEYTLSLPYVQTMQPGGLKYPVHVWWDGPGQKYRFDVYGGMDSNGWNLQEGYYWNLYPRITEVTCDFANGTVGPTARQSLMGLLGLGEGDSASPLPDISGWSYAGTARVRNAEALVWQLSVRNGEKTANYQFYTALNGWPIMFYMMGRNLITGSHFDEYVIEFTRFKPGPIAASAFALPGTCKAAMRQQQQQQQQQQQVENGGALTGMRGVAARVGALLPAAVLGPAQDTSGILNELRTRSETVLEANARFVDEHNRRVRDAATSATSAASGSAGAGGGASAVAEGTSYTLSLNRFAHLTHEQWAAGMLGLKRSTAGGGGSSSAAGAAANGGGRTRLGSAALGTYERVLSNDQLPANVDWRGTGADGPGVKDQVSCGSCWAFSAAGAMQGAWFKATGQSLSFSEQQLVDCAWDYGNDGCAGGFVEPTIQYVVDAGGVTQESEYPYLAQNSFCNGPFAPTTSPPPGDTSTAANAAANATSAVPSQRGGRSSRSVAASARFSGYVNVPSRDEGALMEAVALHGPVAVLMNAALPPFKFYSEGVYYNEQCGQGPESMDHAILLVGYGTTPEGVDYWLIKNSWSKYWGMDGYARIARKGNDCGITTDPVLAVVDAAAVAATVAKTTSAAAAAAATKTVV